MKIQTLMLMGLLISVKLSAAPSEQSVLNHYSDLALAIYQDALHRTGSRGESLAPGTENRAGTERP